jgi:protein TonB
MEEEVMRLLRKSPRWQPAIQDDRKVNVYRKQPVTFLVEEKKQKRKDRT